jgi:hypothetical protein
MRIVKYKAVSPDSMGIPCCHRIRISSDTGTNIRVRSEIKKVLMNQLGTPRPWAREIPRPPRMIAATTIPRAMIKRRVIISWKASLKANMEHTAKRAAAPNMGTHKARDQELATGVSELTINLQETGYKRRPYNR